MTIQSSKILPISVPCYESHFPGGTIQNTCFSSHLAASVQVHGPESPRDMLSCESSIPKQEM